MVRKAGPASPHVFVHTAWEKAHCRVSAVLQPAKTTMKPNGGAGATRHVVLMTLRKKGLKRRYAAQLGGDRRDRDKRLERAVG